jgi:PH (Pleckstrin Homology) domain-containing protein
MDGITNTEENYPASLDFVAILMTGAVFSLSITGLILMISVEPWYGGLFMFASCFVLLPIFYIYSIKAYVLTNESLILKRPFPRFDKSISLSNIISARLAEKGEFKWTIRSAGNGGLFGYSGQYMNNKIGTFTMYAPNRKNKIIIKLEHPAQTIVISPDDPSMVEELNKRLLRSV